MELAICSIFRDEARYLREFVEFHRIVGVSKFYLYNNRSTDNWREVLQPYMDDDVVHVIDWPHRMDGCQVATAQVEAYRDCIRRRQGKHLWMAFIDVDEFLFSPKYNKLITALHDYWTPCTIGGSWMLFGAGNETCYRPEPVIERFTLRTAALDRRYSRWIKNIVDMRDPGISIDRPGGHLFSTAWGTYNENGERLTAEENPVTCEIFRINHYITKSQEEWKLRHPENNAADRFGNQQDKWDSAQGMDIDDRLIHKFLPELKRRLA